MKEPVDHILRPRLPWRAFEDAITECGYDATQVRTLTREAHDARLKELGRQRTAMLTCMTCLDTNARYAHWADDPRQAMSREIDWEIRWGREIRDREQHLKDELFAIAGLIEAHRDEFDQLVDTLKRRRDWLEQKKAAEAQRKAPKPRTPGGLL
jgi:hypothetical protein